MATQTFLRQVTGGLNEVRTVEVSVGAADANKVPNTGATGTIDPSLLNATVASTGATEAGKVVRLDPAGKLDVSTMPVGFGADAVSMQASEAIALGDYVNVWNSAGPRIRKADAATARRADGFVLAAISSGASGLVYFEGTNTQQSGRTPGVTQFLGATGVATETPPTAAGSIVQQIGVALTATSVSFEPHMPITLA